MQSSTAASLPQEVIDLIVSNCDNENLTSAALIARRWRIPAQKHLFAAICYDSGPRTVSCNSRPVQTRVYDVDSLLDSLRKEPLLLTLVKNISMVLRSNMYFDESAALPPTCRLLHHLYASHMPTNGSVADQQNSPNRYYKTVTYIQQASHDQATPTITLFRVIRESAKNLEDPQHTSSGRNEPCIHIDRLILRPQSALPDYTNLLDETLSHDSHGSFISHLRELDIMYFAETSGRLTMMEPFQSLKILRLSSCDPPGPALIHLFSRCPTLEVVEIDCSVADELDLYQFSQPGDGYVVQNLLLALGMMKDTLRELSFRASYDGVSEPDATIQTAFVAYKSLEKLRMPVEFMLQTDPDDADAVAATLPAEQMLPASLERLVLQTNPTMEWYEFSEGFAAQEAAEGKGGTKFYKAGPEALRVFDWLQGIAENAREYLPSLKSVHITTEDGAVTSKECPVHELRPALALLEQFKAAGITLTLR